MQAGRQSGGNNIQAGRIAAWCAGRQKCRKAARYRAGRQKCR